MTFDWAQSRIHCPLDLSAPGKRQGHLNLQHSGNANPLGAYPIPVMVAVGAPGPTTLLIGGVHGDEFEGPVALVDLYRVLDPAALTGRLIFLPALNAPALRESSRVSPLDGGNLNRAFPGDRDGGPTAMLAHMVEAVLMPGCDAAIDLHSGGKASFFAPCALAARRADGTLDPASMALAEAFGAPLVWVLGRHNDNRSVNAAATRRGLPMIAAELGGSGAVTPEILSLARRGLRRCLAHLGHLAEAPEPLPKPRAVEIASPAQKLFSPAEGLVEPLVGAGGTVAQGAPVARLHALDDPGAPPTCIAAPVDGVVLAIGMRGHVGRGGFIALIATDVTG